MQNNVRKFRREMEMSQEKLAEMVGTSRQAIIDIEKGYSKDIYLSKAYRIAHALKRPLEEIFLADNVSQVAHEQKTKAG